MNSMETDLLVSICVLTYNSSEYIIETLDSIKNQNYQNIELTIVLLIIQSYFAHSGLTLIEIDLLGLN